MSSNHHSQISRRHFIKSSTAAMGGLFLGSQWLSQAVAKQTAESNRRPNIVIIFTDDQGYADVGFNPQHGPGIITPNIDRIARDGVTFSQGYVTAAMCLPSRAGLLSGCYQQRYGIHWAEQATRPMRLIADYLREVNYHSTALGKWHSTVNIAGDGNPTENGFDEFYGFNHGGRDYFDLDNTMTDFAPLYRGKKCLKGTGEKGYLTNRLTDEAVNFIKRNREEPFLLYLAYNAVHTPLQAHIVDVEGHHKYSPDPARKILLTMIDYLDQDIGKVLDTLKTEGIYDNTLIFFLTDNGGSCLATHADNTPLRGEKLQLLEGGVRVPFVVSWPAKMAGGRTVDAPVSSLDILPTCLAAAGLPISTDAQLDGLNLLPFLDGKNKLPERDLFWWWKSGPFAGGWAIRSGDWKLIHDPDAGSENLTAGEKLIKQTVLRDSAGNGNLMLYQLVDDPQEQCNVAGKYPERVLELKRKFEKWATAADADAVKSK